MKRIFSALLALALLCGCALAELDAYDLVLELARMLAQMEDVRRAPLNQTDNRAIWTDERTNGRCALVVYDSAEDAAGAELADSTRDTSVCTVESCALYLDSDLGVEAIADYQQFLAEILGVDVEAAQPDYILNVNTKKFHDPYCSSVEDMKETNKQPHTGDRQEVIDLGYVPCKRCDP